MKFAKLVALALVAMLLVFAVSCTPEHVHEKGAEHEAVGGTCKTPGTLAYWDCTGCAEKLDAEGNVMVSIEGTVDPSVHPVDATSTWTKDDDKHEETYDCCGAVKTAEASHSYVEGFCVCGQEDPTVYVTSISLNMTTKVIGTGETATLTATASPSNATSKNVTWSSNKSAVASVDSSGKVTGLSAGTATITATAADGSGVTATCVVTVGPIVNKTLRCRNCGKNHTIRLVTGETWQEALGRNPNGLSGWNDIYLQCDERGDCSIYDPVTGEPITGQDIVDASKAYTTD
ncbi:MAG: Ig domain-containing protein [Spirochaetales bacterium]|nr:Ig domain-containing protein [Candidatus Physcosoma equi]